VAQPASRFTSDGDPALVGCSSTRHRGGIVRTISLLLLLPLSTQALPMAPGAHVPMRLQHPLSTRTSRVGDPVHLRTVHTLIAGSQSIPSGSYAQGVVVRSDRPGRVRGRAALEIAVVSITRPDGTPLPVNGRSPVMEPVEPRLPPPPFARDPRPVIPIMAGMAAMYGTSWLVSKSSNSADRIVGSGAVAGLATGILVGVLKRGDDLVLHPGALIDVMFQTRQ
jgi:hypothetical protein